MTVDDERTIVVEIDLPPGRDWRLYRDLDMVALRRGLTRAQQERAVTELQMEWRCDLSLPGPPPSLTSVA